MSKRTPSFRLPLISHVWSKGLMPSKGTRHEYPEHLRGDMYYEHPESIPIPDSPSYQTVDEVSLSSANALMGGEPLSDCAAELLSDKPLPEFLTEVWSAANQKTVPAIASQYYLPAMRQLVMLCAELQVAAGTGTFFLSCRHAAEITGVNYRRSSRCLAKLEKDGVLLRISTGTVGRSPNAKANEYRYIGG